MLDQNTTENIFRFLQLRAPKTPSPEPEPGPSVDTEFARRLAAAPIRDRVVIAQDFLKNSDNLRTLESEFARAVLSQLRSLTSNATVRQLQERLQAYDSQEADNLRRMLSDAVLAAKYSAGSAGRAAKTYDQLFRALALRGAPPFEPESLKLAEWFHRPLILPKEFALAASRTSPSKTPDTKHRYETPPLDAIRLQRALDELFYLAQPEFLNLLTCH
jgi:hypothetical protein